MKGLTLNQRFLNNTVRNTVQSNRHVMSNVMWRAREKMLELDDDDVHSPRKQHRRREDEEDEDEDEDGEERRRRRRRRPRRRSSSPPAAKQDEKEEGVEKGDGKKDDEDEGEDGDDDDDPAGHSSPFNKKKWRGVGDSRTFTPHPTHTRFLPPPSLIRRFVSSP